MSADISTPPSGLSPPVFYFHAAPKRGGVWPASEPKERVWPFLGEHFKGSLGRTLNACGRGLAGPLEELQSRREESSRNPGDFLSPGLKKAAAGRLPWPRGQGRQGCTSVKGGRQSEAVDSRGRRAGPAFGPGPTPS